MAIATAAFCSVASALYVLARVEPFPFVAWFLTTGPLLMVVLWLDQDAHRRGIGAVHDLEFFLFLFWPFVIPWYAFASRGPAGWKLLIGVIALLAAAPLTIAILRWFRFP
jgi:hypothetical protein